MSDRVVERAVLPEAIETSIREFGETLGLAIRAWQHLDGAKIPVVEIGEVCPGDEASGHQFTVDPREGPPLELWIGGGDGSAAAAKLLQSTLSRTYDLRPGDRFLHIRAL